MNCSTQSWRLFWTSKYSVIEIGVKLRWSLTPITKSSCAMFLWFADFKISTKGSVRAIFYIMLIFRDAFVFFFFMVFFCNTLITHDVFNICLIIYFVLLHVNHMCVICQETQSSHLYLALGTFCTTIRDKFRTRHSTWWGKRFHR